MLPVGSVPYEARLRADESQKEIVKWELSFAMVDA